MNELLEALRALPKAERRAAALLANPTFQEAVRLASEEDDEALFALVRGDRMTALVALEALAQRDGERGHAAAARAAARAARTRASCCGRWTAASARGSSRACWSRPATPGCARR